MINGTFCDKYLSALDPQIQQIEQAADDILRNVGLQFEGDVETLDIWRSHGAIVEQDRVYLDGVQLRENIRATAPQSFGILAQSPEHDRCIGKDHAAVFAPIYGAPNVLTSHGQRLPGSRALYRDLVALADQNTAITNTGQMICVMNDVPEQDRPAEMAQAHLQGSKKPLMGSVASPHAVVDVIKMVRASTNRAGTSPSWPAKTAHCQLLHLINSTPPLTYKANALQCLRAVARNGEGCIVTSYMMLGATGPTTLAGALALGYAECLAGLALSQLWQPGTPVVMGLFATAFSMQHMQPIFGDPLSQNVQFYSVALARHLGVPARGDGGITNALIDDAQAGYEGGRNMNSTLMAGSDFVLHAAGWLEGGRCVSFDKFNREANAIATILKI
jgi:trimethylamine--corrinoid protein Co-methyltransferase